MPSLKVSGAALAATMMAVLVSPSARAQETLPVAQAPAAPAYDEYPAADAPQGQGQPQPQDSPIPQYVEGPAVAAEGGSGYCYVGPHPVDTRVVPGPAFDDTQGQHIRPYAPIDLRLFSFRNGCYYFIGDPRDFGYGGQIYSYYGAHPILDAYGGGWCFMMGGHSHLWGQWSPYFSVVGPWYYWYGPYDPFFWSYWPYYSYYYRSYYPTFYAGGRYYSGGFRAAPPIHRVPTTVWRGSPPAVAGTPAGGWRGAPPAGPGASGTGAPWRGTPPPSSSTVGTWRAPSATPAVTPMRSTAPAPRGWGAPPSSAPRSFGPPPAGGGWRGSPAPSAPFHAAPAPSGGFSAPRMPSGGGFRGGHHR